MLYSAVNQPFPVPTRNGGTPSTGDTVQSTFVSPISIRADPAAVFRYLGEICTGRN